VILNAAAAVFVSGNGAMEFGDAVAHVRGALQDGAGLDALDRLRSSYLV
jgi:anthranilate phosphoribosyltransferase